MRTHTNLVKDERGVVSIIVSILIMIIISVIAISFARLMQREQAQALDRQLSTQAYYAAEAGVNDARKAYLSGQIDADDHKTCTSDPGNPLSQEDINTELEVSYTCVTVNDRPSDLIFDSVSTDRSLVARISGGTTGNTLENISEMTIAWEDPDGGASFDTTSAESSSSSFQSASGWGSRTGVVMIQIQTVPAGNAAFTRQDLDNASKTYYLYPTTFSTGPGGSFSWNTRPSGSVINGSCTATVTAPKLRKCQVTLTDIPVSRGSTFNLRMKSVYRPVAITLTARASSGGPNVNFDGVQVVIDSTGRANDVLRRIEERFPISYGFDYPEHALETGTDICKRLVVSPLPAGGTESTVEAGLPASCSL